MSDTYDLYLKSHLLNVRRGFRFLQEYCPELILELPGVDWEYQILVSHDQSKYYPDEYEAYDRRFYLNNRSINDQLAFDRAFLTHIHRNPHHWQHWVFHSDDSKNGLTVVQMPYNYVLEMFCDWWSFSWMSKDLTTVFDWYSARINSIILHENSRAHLVNILNTVEDTLFGLEADGVDIRALIERGAYGSL